MGDCYEKGERYLSKDHECICGYCRESYGRLCGSDGIFFHVVYDSDHSAPSYDGTIYAGDESRRHDGSDPGISCIGGFSDHVDRESGL